MVKKKINKKRLSVYGEHSRTISQRHSGVVLEDIDSKLDLLVEGHRGLNEKIDKVDKKLDNFRNEVDKRFNEVDYKFEIVFDELHLIRNELKEKVSRDEFLVLEKRVMALEKSKNKDEFEK